MHFHVFLNMCLTSTDNLYDSTAKLVWCCAAAHPLPDFPKVDPLDLPEGWTVDGVLEEALKEASGAQQLAPQTVEKLKAAKLQRSKGAAYETLWLEHSLQAGINEVLQLCCKAILLCCLLTPGRIYAETGSVGRAALEATPVGEQGATLEAPGIPGTSLGHRINLPNGLAAAATEVPLIQI